MEAYIRTSFSDSILPASMHPVVCSANTRLQGYGSLKTITHSEIPQNNLMKWSFLYYFMTSDHYIAACCHINSNYHMYH